MRFIGFRVRVYRVYMACRVYRASGSYRACRPVYEVYWVLRLGFRGFAGFIGCIRFIGFRDRVCRVYSLYRVWVYQAHRACFGVWASGCESWGQETGMTEGRRFPRLDGKG